LDVYKSDAEQIDTLRKWWDENGRSILTGVILGLVAIFGWRAWQDYVRQQAEAASELYQNVLAAVDGENAGKEVAVISAKIIEDYGTTAYALLVKLIEAKLAVKAEDYDAAVDHLRWALDHNEVDSIEHIIRLRLAKALAHLKKFDEALPLLRIGDQGEFAAAYAEAEADILMSLGDVAAARALYEQALSRRQTAGLDVSILDLKLNDLGRPAQ
jgi:predicted negative regulator of RcsB-dependent stress response